MRLACKRRGVTLRYDKPVVATEQRLKTRKRYVAHIILKYIRTYAY